MVDAGNPFMMKAEQRHSLTALGVRDVRTAEQRTKQRVEDEAAEAHASQVLVQLPPFKLRGRQVSLAEYIMEGRVRVSLVTCIFVRICISVNLAPTPDTACSPLSEMRTQARYGVHFEPCTAVVRDLSYTARLPAGEQMSTVGMFHFLRLALLTTPFQHRCSASDRLTRSARSYRTSTLRCDPTR